MRAEIRTALERLAAVCVRSQLVGEWRRGNPHAQVLEMVAECGEVQVQSLSDFFATERVKSIDREVDKLVTEGALERRDGKLWFTGTQVELVIHPVKSDVFVTKVIRLSYSRAYTVDIAAACRAKNVRWVDAGFVKADKKKPEGDAYRPKDEADFFAFLGMAHVPPSEVLKCTMTADGFQRFIDGNVWKASTSPQYAHCPHAYVLRVKARNQKEFTQAVLYVREYGEIQYFYSVQNYYIITGGRKYWTMTDPAATAGIVNRAQI